MRWERINVFISSTFNDMHAERDYLVKRVFPELTEWCEERKISLVDIDLRWGITAADSTSKNTVSACLHSIDEARPFFLCFLGQRRGWIPGAEDISAHTIEDYPGLRKHIGNESVTEMEIEHALLAPMIRLAEGVRNVPAPVEHALFYFRDDRYLSVMDKAQRSIYTNATEKDESAADTALNDFKQRICDHWHMVKEYGCRFDEQEKSLSDFTVEGRPLGEVVIEDLKHEIETVFPERKHTASQAPLAAELEKQSLFVEQNAEEYIRRKDDFDALDGYIQDDCRAPLLLAAEAGLGKTILLANYLQQLQSADRKVFARFVGISNLSGSVYGLWRSICDEAGIPCPQSAKELRSEIGKTLETLTAKGNTVILIDAVDQLPGGLTMLSWLPRQLPQGVKLIVSCKMSPESADLLSRLSSNYTTMKLLPLANSGEQRAIINAYLNKYMKSLDDELIDTICALPAARNPLYLKVLLSELRVFGDFHKLNEQIHTFGDTPQSAFDAMLKRLENERVFDGQAGLSAAVFGLLGAARNGLTESELLRCLHAKHPDRQMDGLRDGLRTLLRSVRPFLTRMDGRTDFRYDSLRKASEQRYGKELERHHNLLAAVFLQDADPEGDFRFSGANARAFSELAYHLYHARCTQLLQQTLRNDLYMRARIRFSGVDELVLDYDYTEGADVLLIGKAIAMSTHALRGDPAQLTTQLWGRLLGMDHPVIRELLANAEKHETGIWGKLRNAALHSPDGDICRMLSGHTREIHSLAVASRAPRAVSLSCEHELRIWNTQTGDCVYSLSANESIFRGDCYCTAISADGSLAMTASLSGDLRVWDADAGVCLRELKGHTDYIVALAMTPDGHFAASAGSDKTVRMWDVTNGDELCVISVEYGSRKLALSADGQTLFFQSEEHIISICAAQTGKWLKNLYLTEAASHIAVSADGLLLLAAQEKCVICWDVENGMRRDSFNYTHDITYLSITPDGLFAAAVCDRTDIILLDIKQGKISRTFPAVSQVIPAIAISGEDGLIYAVTNEDTIQVLAWRDTRNNAPENTGGHTKAVTAVALTGDGRAAVSAAADYTIQLWDTKKMRWIRTIAEVNSCVTGLAILPNKKVFLSSSELRIENYSHDFHENCVTAWSLRKHNRRFTAITRLLANLIHLQIDEKLKVTLLGDSVYKGLYEMRTKQRIRRFANKISHFTQHQNKNAFLLEKHVKTRSIAAVSPDLEYVVCIEDYQKRLSFWRNEGDFCCWRITGHTRAILCAAVSRDGSLVASGSRDNTVRLWNGTTGECERILTGHNRAIVSLAFIADGQYLVSASHDNTLCVWKTASWECVAKATLDDTPACMCTRYEDTLTLVGCLSGRVLALQWQGLV